MAKPIDKDTKYLTSLLSSDTWDYSRRKDQLTHKLLYLILEESAASRRQAEYTNTLLAEIASSVKKSTTALECIAKTAVQENHMTDEWRLRTTRH